MASEKTIKGQAWINTEKNSDGTTKCSLVQDQVVIISGQGSYSKTEILVDDIVKDLTSANGKYKTNDRGYFYWEYKMTDSENDDVELTLKFDCPRPFDNMFIKEDTGEVIPISEAEGAYAEYWVPRLHTAFENYEKQIAIQRKEITFAGTTYMDQKGNQVKVDDITVKNNDVSDITNLLNIF